MHRAKVLRTRLCRRFGRVMVDLKGIPSGVCFHILLEDVAVAPTAGAIIEYESVKDLLRNRFVYSVSSEPKAVDFKIQAVKETQC